MPRTKNQKTTRKARNEASSNAPPSERGGLSGHSRRRGTTPPPQSTGVTSSRPLQQREPSSARQPGPRSASAQPSPSDQPALLGPSAANQSNVGPERVPKSIRVARNRATRLVPQEAKRPRTRGYEPARVNPPDGLCKLPDDLWYMIAAEYLNFADILSLASTSKGLRYKNTFQQYLKYGRYCLSVLDVGKTEPLFDPSNKACPRKLVNRLCLAGRGVGKDYWQNFFCTGRSIRTEAAIRALKSANPGCGKMSSRKMKTSMEATAQALAEMTGLRELYLCLEPAELDCLVPIMSKVRVDWLTVHVIGAGGSVQSQNNALFSFIGGITGEINHQSLAGIDYDDDESDENEIELDLGISHAPVELDTLAGKRGFVAKGFAWLAVQMNDDLWERLWRILHPEKWGPDLEDITFVHHVPVAAQVMSLQQQSEFWPLDWRKLRKLQWQGFEVPDVILRNFLTSHPALEQLGVEYLSHVGDGAARDVRTAVWKFQKTYLTRAPVDDHQA